MNVAVIMATGLLFLAFWSLAEFISKPRFDFKQMALLGATLWLLFAANHILWANDRAATLLALLDLYKILLGRGVGA